MPAKTRITLSLLVLVAVFAGCVDLDWDGVEYDAQATHAASGPEEERAYATATAEARNAQHTPQP